MTTPNNCVFCTATNRLLDFIPDGSDGAAAITRLTPVNGTALVVLPVDTAWRRYENAFKSEHVEITDARFHEMLGVLPPVGWSHSDRSFESFKISECTAGSITAIFVRIHDRYFELSDSITLPHRECVSRVPRKLHAEKVDVQA